MPRADSFFSQRRKDAEARSFLNTRIDLSLTSYFLAVSLCSSVALCESAAPWRNLAQTQEALGFTDYTWDGDSVCFSNDASVVRFYQGRRRSEVDGTVVWLNEAPDGNVNAGEWRMAETDVNLLSLAMLPKGCNAIKPLRVVLDAGHGGVDSGARSRAPAVSEKTLTLDLARKVGQRLESLGMQVSYTRTNDVAVDLNERIRMARKTSADVFVSIHANFASNTNACGPETYVVTPAGFAGTSENTKARGFQIGNANDYHNTLLGYSMQRYLARVDPGVVDRGLKRQSFFVLRETSCPSVLVEVGFLSNAVEAKSMLTPAWQDDCADAIMRGVVEYARKVDTLTRAVNERRQGSPPVTGQGTGDTGQGTADNAPPPETNPVKPDYPANPIRKEEPQTIFDFDQLEEDAG